MIFFLTIFFIFITFISLFIFKNFQRRIKEVSNKKKIKYFYFFSLLFVLVVSGTIYVTRSNFWLGDDLISKIMDNQNINNQKILDLNLINNIINDLERDLEANKDSVDIIESLANTKFLIGDYVGAAEAYKKARGHEPNNLDFLKGEANARLFFEKNRTSDYTSELFARIINREPSNLIALAVLAEKLSEKNNFNRAKEYYLRLLNLLEKDSLEYTNIRKKLKEVENRLNDKTGK
tara:strand:- start:482 stop:1186 length:705 start_codon:yes stop_codon:yes gene_type:complete